MEGTITITLPTKVKSALDNVIQEEGVSPNELISTAIEEYLFFRQLRLLRERMIVKAQAQGIYTDQDVFDWEQWDRQIERDAESGKLDLLIEEAFAEKEQGRLKEL